jgi:hypothetical protein
MRGRQYWNSSIKKDFWWRRMDGIGLDTATKEFLAIEFQRTQDARNNYVERATAVAQEEYIIKKKESADGSPIGQSSQRVEGTTDSVCSRDVRIHQSHVESLNRNMKALGVLESKWDPIRKKLVRRLLEEQDKVLRPSSHKREGL